MSFSVFHRSVLILHLPIAAQPPHRSIATLNDEHIFIEYSNGFLITPPTGWGEFEVQHRALG